MKIQRRPFRVEVKRGTSRSAFISPSQEPDVFRKAEAQLFRATQPQESVSGRVVSKGTSPSRRVLQAIEEPQTPLLPTSYEAPARRGRKPGSKNKPKLSGAVGVDGIPPSLRLDDSVPKGRGRPPGSRNRVRSIDLPENARRASLTSAEAREDVSVWNDASTLSDLELVTKRRGHPFESKNKAKLSGTGPNIPTRLLLALKAAGVDVDAGEVSTSHERGAPENVVQTTPKVPDPSMTPDPQPIPARGKLRDRSKILKRYVWGMEPKAGEKGYRRRMG